MNRAIPEQNSKLWLIFLTKILIRLNWLFQWLLLFLLVGELYLLLGNSPQGVHGGPMGWGDGGFMSHMPSQTSGSLSFSSFLLLWDSAGSLKHPIVPASSAGSFGYDPEHHCWWKEACEIAELHKVHGTVGWHWLLFVPSLLKWHQSHLWPIPLRDFGEAICIRLLGLI